MFKFFAATAAVLTAAAAGVARAPVAPAQLHHDHLAIALKDIAEAEAAAKAGSVAAARRHTAAAVRQIESVLHHHHAAAALGGGLTAAHHHHHHHHLRQAVTDLRAAEKQLARGHRGPAERDLAKAAVQVGEAMGQHEKK